MHHLDDAVSLIESNYGESLRGCEVREIPNGLLLYRAAGAPRSTATVQPMLQFKDDASCESWHELGSDIQCYWLIYESTDRERQADAGEYAELMGIELSELSDTDQSWKVAHL